MPPCHFVHTFVDELGRFLGLCWSSSRPGWHARTEFVGRRHGFGDDRDATAFNLVERPRPILVVAHADYLRVSLFGIA